MHARPRSALGRPSPSSSGHRLSQRLESCFQTPRVGQCGSDIGGARAAERESQLESQIVPAELSQVHPQLAASRVASRVASPPMTAALISPTGTLRWPPLPPERDPTASAAIYFLAALGSFAPSARSILAMIWLFGIALPDSYSLIT